jgi:hypothetical protein
MGELDACFLPAASFAYYSTLKKEEVISSEESGNFHMTTRRHIPGDSIL